MPEFTSEHAAMLIETHDAVIQISAVLLDTNGNQGLASRMKESCDKIDRKAEEDDLKEVKKDLSKLKRVVFSLIAFLAGSGALGTSIWGIIQLAS